MCLEVKKWFYFLTYKSITRVALNTIFTRTENIFLCNRTRNEHFAYLKQAAKSNLLLTTAAKVNVILIFNKNRVSHVRLSFTFFRYQIRKDRIDNTYFLTLEEYTKLKHHCICNWDFFGMSGPKVYGFKIFKF
jgi:hypothetical protein